MLSFALPLLLAAAPASFASADIADGQCLAAFSMMAGGKDKQMEQAGIIGSIYFYGKIVGRNPSADVTALLRSIAADVKKNPAPYLGRCGKELSASGDALTASGKTLAAEGI